MRKRSRKKRSPRQPGRHLEQMFVLIMGSKFDMVKILHFKYSSFYIKKLKRIKE